MIHLPLLWRAMVLMAAVGLVPMLMFTHWVVRQWSRSYLGARLVVGSPVHRRPPPTAGRGHERRHPRQPGHGLRSHAFMCLRAVGGRPFLFAGLRQR